MVVLDETLDLVPDVLVTPIDPDDSPQLLYGVKLPSGAHSFLDGTVRTGLDDSRGTMHGLVVAQFDPDARPDIYLGRTVASDAIYYRSEERPESAKLSGAGVQLVGGLGGNDAGAVGAKVVLKQDGQPVALAVVGGGSGRGSQGSPQLTFATPDSLASYSVEITWREGHVQTAAVQRDTLTVIPDHTNPTIAPASMSASYQPEVGGLATWTFYFDTLWLPKLDGNEIVVSSTAGCLNEPITLRDSQPNVTVTIAVKAGGGWTHTVVATGMPCIPNCVYTWYCKSSTQYETSTTQGSPKTFKTKVCAQ